MGTYINPGNSGFENIIKGIYVDKSDMIDTINRRINTSRNLICVSRPRRFGKSYAAKMLAAYYDKSCDSDKLFENLNVSKTEDYSKYLNGFNVVYLDITGFISKNDSIKDVVRDIRNSISKELEEMFLITKAESLGETFLRASQKTGERFVFIIDEWDALVREAKDDEEIQKEYFKLLRELFKNGNVTDRVVAFAYLTGILPIKKDGTQSAISDFTEYSIISPGVFGEYIGFTGDEIEKLCCEYSINLDTMRRWYDGYHIPGVGDVYNPNSVINAIESKTFESYWSKTSATDSLLKYIDMDFDGLSKSIAELIGGSSVAVNVDGFSNDVATFKGRDDILTLLIHLGYLTYESESQTAIIPNEEIRREFVNTFKRSSKQETIKRIEECDNLIKAIINMDSNQVAEIIEKIHNEETTALFYNNEQELRSVIKLALFSYRDNYISFEELPAGKGYADIVYLPKKDSLYPALIIELKWNKTAEGALEQIRKNDYPAAIAGYDGEILLVGINYDDEKKHECMIERLTTASK